MPVTTINLDDFLVPKNSGDVVTGEDWNKLVSLFHAVNGNASTLLDMMKAVDVNTANIAQVTQGAVPDGSIGYAKLSKLGGTTNEYILTSDLTPTEGVTYYTLEGVNYIPHTDLIAFEAGTQYYTLETVATAAAVSGPEVIGDGVIENYHLAANTLLPTACSELLLGGLLNDNATVYTDKGVSGTIPAGEAPTTIEHTIVLDKPHKVLVIAQAGGLIVLTAEDGKPNLFIGGITTGLKSGEAVSGGLYVRRLVGDKKQTAPQVASELWPMEAPKCYAANYPSGLFAEQMQLTLCDYDYSTRSIKLKAHTLSNRSATFKAQNYTFGDLIIGL